MKKKAFIEQIMLGGILLLGIIVFSATVADDMLARNKLYQLKNITKAAGFAAARHYTVNVEDEFAANNAGAMPTDTQKKAISEDRANNIIRDMTLGVELIGDGTTNSSENGSSYSNTDTGYSLTYTWIDEDADGSPDKLTATTSIYNHSTFWYRFLGKDSIPMSNSATYLIESSDDDDGVGPSVPIGVNGCGQNFSDNTGTVEYSFIYQTILDVNANSYTLDATDNEGFYAIYDNNDSQTNNQQELAHVKQYINGTKDFDYSGGDIYTVTAEQDDIHNDIAQFSKVFPDPLTDSEEDLFMKIVVLPCGQDAATEVDTSNTIDIKIESLKCSTQMYSEATFITELSDYVNDDNAVDGDGNAIWEDVDNNGCSGNNSGIQAFKIKFTIVPASKEVNPEWNQ